jgi:rare lipoprotein A
MQKSLFILFLLFANYNLLFAQSQTGIASVRHLAHEGKLTKTGEFFSHDSLVASHRSIPFGSIVKITNLKNQKTVDVRINDRGPFINHHIIDLSEFAAQKIGLAVKNRTEVRIDIIKLEKAFKVEDFQNFQDEEGEYSIKMGSFEDKINATDYAKRLTADYNLDNISITEDTYDGKPYFKVYIGKFSSRSIAEQYLAQLPKALQSGYVTTLE